MSFLIFLAMELKLIILSLFSRFVTQLFCYSHVTDLCLHIYVYYAFDMVIAMYIVLFFLVL
jgi:hypothetical protein